MHTQLFASGSFREFADELNSMADDLTAGRRFVRFSPTDVWHPSVNVYETPEALIVCVDIAGMDAKDINVEVIDKTLIIRGRRTPPLPPDVVPGKTRLHLMEIDNGAFSRELEVPATVRRDKIEADYRDGLLWIRLPVA